MNNLMLIIMCGVAFAAGNINAATKDDAEDIFGDKEQEISKIWRDLSTTEDGISPVECTEKSQQCVFRHSSSMQEITTVTVRESLSGTSELRTYEGADSACKGLQNWGGHSDWRLPTYGELFTHRNDLVGLFRSYKFLNSGAHYFWTTSHLLSPELLPKEQLGQEAELLWALELTSGKSRQLNPRAVVNFICIRDTLNTEKNWKDDSRTAGGIESSCIESEGNCLYTNLKDGITWATGSVVSFAYVREAQTACQQLRAAGYDDWRLPLLSEVISANQAGIAYLRTKTDLFFQLTKTEITKDFSVRMDAYDYPVFGYDLSRFPVKPDSTGRVILENRKLFNASNYFVAIINCVRAKNVKPVPKIDPVVITISDGDEDGVSDQDDRCPGTAKGATVWKKGQMLSDGRSSDSFAGCSVGQTPK